VEVRTDAELFRQAGRDPEFFGVVYRRHVGAIYGRLRRETASEAVAADLAAETFAQAFLHFRRFRDPGDGSAGPWLHGIASNLLASYRRSEHLSQRALRRLGLPTSLALDADLPQVEDREWARTLAESVGGGLAALPRTQREALQLRVVEGLSYREIGHRVGCEPELARARVSRGLRALRSTLSREARQ
jgi:RNA polymerase sigma-70 factor (ECF subfamily)